MSTSSTSSAATNYFNGSSTFSADLENVISRAVGIANLPITLLQNQQDTLSSQQTELQSLSTDFQSLQTALGTLNSAASTGSFAATVDTPTVASAAVSAGALPGSYSLTIGSLGAKTNTITTGTGVTDPSSGNISTSSAFTLTVDGTPYTLSASSNLNSLVQAINSSGANVQATIVNVGGSTPSYQLSIQGTHYAATTIQLNDGTSDLLSMVGSLGSNVTYQVNGQPSTPATSTTRTLSISSGLTVTALAVGTTDVTVAQNASGVQSALSALATSYNAAVDELAKNRGQNGGALAGNSIVSQLSNVLHSLTNYSASSGSIQSLTDLGLTFDQSGHLQLDTTVFNAAANNSLSSVMSFLGSESDATSFLSNASQALTSATDQTTGAITTATNSIGTSIINITSKITDDQARITLMQTNLTAQMAAADAAIASLQSQVSEITAMFTAQQVESKAISG